MHFPLDFYAALPIRNASTSAGPSSRKTKDGEVFEQEIHICNWFVNEQQGPLNETAMMDITPTESAAIESVPDFQDVTVRDKLFAVMSSLVDREDELQIATIAATGGAAFQVRAAASGTRATGL